MSILLDNIRTALIGLRSNKLRAFLTMLGITIGVAAVIALVSIGQAIEEYVTEEFEGIGSNLLFVFGFNDEGDFEPLTQSDVRAISDFFRVPDALRVMPQRGVTRPVVSEGREISISVQGVMPNYTAIYSRDVVAGRF